MDAPESIWWCRKIKQGWLVDNLLMNKLKMCPGLFWSGGKPFCEYANGEPCDARRYRLVAEEGDGGK